MKKIATYGQNKQLWMTSQNVSTVWQTFTDAKSLVVFYLLYVLNVYPEIK